MKLPAFSILLSVAPSFSATTVVATESVKNVRGSLDEDATKFKHARVVPDVLSKEAIETIQRNGRLGNGENDGVNRRFGEEVEDEQIPVVAGSLVSFKGNTLSHGTNGAEVRLLSPVNTQDLVSVDNIVVPREQRLLGATTNQGNKDLSPISRKLPAGPNSNACNGICTAKEAAGCEDCADPVPQSKGCDRLCGAVEFFECECGASPTDPTQSPSIKPTEGPTVSPSSPPTQIPTTSSPSKSPSLSPTSDPTVSPSRSPETSSPSKSPSLSPTTSSPTTSNPTVSPSQSPETSSPSKSPSLSPITSSPTTSDPTVSPSQSPETSSPSKSPSLSPTTSSPTTSDPTVSPSQSPVTSGPTDAPSRSPLTSSPTTTPTAAPVTPPRIVFVTSVKYTGGAIGGIAGADSECQTLAIEAELSGTFKAWLSDSTDSPDQDFVKSDVPYVTTNGTKVADDWQDLITDNGFGWLDNAIAFDEKGDSTSGYVWTGTSATGNSDSGGGADFCDDWTSTSGFAKIGFSSASDGEWTSFANGRCGATRRLYCFEQ